MKSVRVGALLCAAAVFAGCPKPPGPGEEDGGRTVPDECNSQDEALNQPNCELTLGTVREAYLGAPGDEDWYSFRTPADATARTLVHLTGGYAVPNTAVQLSLNLLREDGQQSLARKSDRHGQGAPQPVDIILPFSEPNARLLVLVNDDPSNPSRPQFDARAQYQLKAEVVTDPDQNEPNDTTPTPIALTQQGQALQGTSTGYLSTNNDVDSFTFDVPAGKKVIYLALTAPLLAPPPPFRLQYELYDPSGTRISEGTVQNAYLAVNLATARLSKGAGAYKVVVKGYVGQGSTAPVPGDLRLQYTVDARVFDETDPSEGANQNDTLETARTLSLNAPGQTSATGRIGYVPDPDWYRVDLAANPAPTVLYYRLSPGNGQGRFPALPGTEDRELRVLRQVADATSCMQDPVVCPKSFGNDPLLSGLVSEQCTQFSPARCLWSLRNEHPEFDNLRNFQGAIPVPPHTSTMSVYVLVQDAQNNWADDVDYTLSLDWRNDPDDASRTSGSVEQPEAHVLAEDVGGATFPVPPTGAAYEFSGRLSHGYGYFRDHDPNFGQGVRGPSDYDAVASDRDRYVLSLPVVPDPMDRTWEVEWEVAKTPDGGVPYDLAVELQFCDGDLSTGNCVPVKTGSKGGPLTLSYTDEPRNAWHNAGNGSSVRQPLYDRTETSSAIITTARAYGCFCFEPRFIKGGQFYMTVTAVDRDSYADTTYTVRTAYTDYPKTYAGNDGGTQSCPPRDATDGGGGCYFTFEP